MVFGSVFHYSTNKTVQADRKNKRHFTHPQIDGIGHITVIACRAFFARIHQAEMRGFLLDPMMGALLHESLNGSDRVHLSEVGTLFDGYRYRLTELAKAIEDGATQLGFSLLTIGMFCA
jgi:hypothetical protein